MNDVVTGGQRSSGSAPRSWAPRLRLREMATLMLPHRS
jgi:hypothetical protein